MRHDCDSCCILSLAQDHGRFWSSPGRWNFLFCIHRSRFFPCISNFSTCREARRAGDFFPSHRPVCTHIHTTLDHATAFVGWQLDISNWEGDGVGESVSDGGNGEGRPGISREAGLFCTIFGCHKGRFQVAWEVLVFLFSVSIPLLVVDMLA